MSTIFLINAHEYYPFSAGKLNNTRVEKAGEILSHRWHQARTTTMNEDYDIAAELEKHQWADATLLQTPVNRMGAPRTFRKHMETVCSAGIDGTLCDGDGRTRSDPAKQYGTGATLSDNVTCSR